MPAEGVPLDIDNLVRRYVAGEKQQALAEAFGVSVAVVRNRLLKAGVQMRTRSEWNTGAARVRLPVDDAEIARRYLAGESEKALAAALGTSRSAIRRRLDRQGVQARGRSESMYLRMAQATPEERAELASAAHGAVRGKSKTPEFLLARALGVERKGAEAGSVSPAELMLAAWLREAGLTVAHQKAVGPYNVDLATGSVAVEVLGGGWHRSKKHRKRLRHILDAGWDVIYVWVDGRRSPLTAGAAEYVIAHLEFRDRNPAAPRCYRVIRGGGQFVAEGSADGDNLPDILPIGDGEDVRPAVRLPEVPYGFCHCGCGKRTTIVSSRNAGGGYAVGQPRMFIHGHYVRLTRRSRNAG